MRRFGLVMIFALVSFAPLDNFENSRAQDDATSRIELSDLAPLTPENVLYIEQVAELDPAVDDPITSVQFSPENASFITTTQKAVMFWSLEGALNGDAPLMKIEDEEWVQTQFETDNRLVAIGTPSGIEVWDTVSIERIGQFVGGHERRQVMVFSPDGSLLVYQLDQNLRYWDTVERVEFASRLVTEPAIWSAAISPDEKYVALRLEDGRTRIEFLDFPDIDRVAILEHGQDDYFELSGLDFSPQGRWFFAYGEALFIEVWDTETWTFDRRLDLPPYGIAVDYLEFDPNTHFMVGNSHSSALYRWELDETADELSISQLFHGDVPNVAFTSDSQLLGITWTNPAGASAEAVYIINPITGRPYVGQSSSPILVDRGIGFSVDNRLFAFPKGQANTIGFYGVPTNIQTAQSTFPTFNVSALLTTPNLSITSETVQDIELLNVVNVWEIASIEGNTVFTAYPVIYHPENNKLIWTSGAQYFPMDDIITPDIFIYEWDFDDAPQIARTISDCNCFVEALGYLSDGRLVALIYDHIAEQMSAVDVESLETLSTINTELYNRYTFSPDGKQVVVSEIISGITPRQWNTTLWDIESGENRLFEPMATGSAVFRPDGEVIYGGGVVWDAETGELLHEYARDFGYPDGVQVMLSGAVEYGWRNHFILEDGRMISAGGSMAISPDQSLIARTFPPDSLRPSLKQIELVDTTTGEILAILDLGEDERGYSGNILFSAGGTRLVYISQRGDIRVWGIVQ